MKRRVGGLETEYGLVAVRADGTRALEPEAAARELFRPVVAMGRSSNVFLDNGSRLYLDVGSHPEVATAECDDWWDLVAQDKAGEATLAELVGTADAAFAERDEDVQLHLFKNNVDSAGNSFGSHENYLVDRRGEFTRLPQHLVPFLVTRQIVTGAGGVVREEDGTARYVFSRRSDHMWEAVSSATTRTRPIINTRDEPHGDASRFRRLHVISGDSTMSEVSTWLRFATTDLVLRLIESGRSLPDLSLADDITAIRVVARDLRGSEQLPLADGGTASALDLQQRYLDAVTSVGEDGDREVLETWQRALDALRSGDLSWAERTLDWAIKQKLLMGTAERRGLTDLGDPMLERLDLAYHDIAPGRGLFPRLQQRGLAPSVLPAERLERARHVAPATTRAHLRGQVVTAARAGGVDVAVDWTTMRLGRPGELPVTLMDPFTTQSDEVDALLQRIEQVGGAAATPPAL
ncbi:Pup--protein ligase [Brachybacterium sp. EF45031]|uniref:Pup--protein ligase n=1 Tax=Brachybacterium sillae TaxID=2810536 RepID=UPI00217D4C92|nr:Pup--protein ligase [Brachybacterium sillae]MCS6710677.1 Pup--protein ligase [Brachybacterium sillae]